MRKILLICWSLFASSILFSQVVINEYSAANYDGIDFQVGAGSDYNDWIEFYNNSAATIDLSGYYLTDKLNNLTKWQFPAGTNIAAGDHLVVLASSKDAFVNGYINTNFKLTQTKGNEYIILSNSSSIIVDSIRLNYANQENHSRGRITDGAGTWGIFSSPTLDNSNTGALTKYANSVNFSIAPGFYTGTQTISLTTTEPTSSIRYTTNGSEPTAGSTLYTSPITVANTTVIRAKVFSTNPSVFESHIETNTYFINVTHTVKVISVCGNILFDLFDGDDFLEPHGSMELFETDGTFLTEATGEFNKHGNDSWFYDQRGVDFIARDQLGINYALEDEIFDTKDRDEFQKVILKCGASDNYPFEPGGAHIRDAYINEMSQLGDLRLDERSNEFAVLYLNGAYWGVYDIREKTDDDDFTDYYYDQDVPDIQYLKTWGGTWEKYGAPNAQNDWDDFVDFVDLNDMTIQANYDYVDSVYNTGSLIDYFVLNGYVVCSDWLNWNTGWWRGMNPNGDKKKWRYTLWDMDATFGHYVNYTGIPNQGANADPCDPESLGDPGGEGHVPIWNKLQTNDDFFADYINRYAELSSTVFSCDSMHNLLDRMVAEIQPEMQLHINRWGGSMATWQANVQEIHTFIDTRCTVVVTGLVGCNPEISGPYELIVNVDPPLSGEVQLSSMTPTTYPYSGTYFGGVNISLDADPFTNWVFDYWTIANDTLLPNVNMEQVLLTMSSDDTVVAHFVPDVFTPMDTITYIVTPVGAGTVNINGNLQSTFPFTEDYTAGSFMTLNATANAGFSFNNWAMANHTPNPNNTSPSVSLTLGTNDTVYVNFDTVGVTPTPMDTITFIVSPVGAGNVTINGGLQTTFSYTNSYSDGSLMTLNANANTGFIFNNWAMANHSPNPNNTNPSVSLTLGSNDTFYVNFNAIVPTINDTIVYAVDPIGAGDISLNGNNLNPLPFTKISTTGGNENIVASPNGNYVFSYWENTTNSLLSTSQASTSFTSNFNDTIIAHFDSLTVDTLIVIMQPNGAGTLNIEGDIITTTPFVGVYSLNEILDLEAQANPGNSFNRWELNNQNLPDFSPLTSFVFINQDTLFAYFNTPTYINDLGEDFEFFTIFPSVNNGDFQIQYLLTENTDIQLELISSSGQIVGFWNLANKYANTSYLDDLHFEGANGMYLLKISSGKTNAIEKMIKID